LFLLDNLSSFYFSFWQGSIVTKPTVVIFNSVANLSEFFVLRGINFFPQKAQAFSIPPRAKFEKAKKILTSTMGCIAES